jgi:hypothetical protein
MGTQEIMEVFVQEVFVNILQKIAHLDVQKVFVIPIFVLV